MSVVQQVMNRVMVIGRRKLIFADFKITLFN